MARLTDTDGFAFYGRCVAVGLVISISLGTVAMETTGKLQQQQAVDIVDRTDTKLICYYTNWSQYRPDGGKYLPENIDVTLCTHIVYAFAKLENGVLAPYEWNDDSSPWMKGMYERVNDLKKQKPELRTLLAVGGWSMGSAPFSQMVATKESRHRFATHAVEFLRNRTFDGLELDWEYPGGRGSPPEDKQKFTALMQEVRQVFEDDATSTARPRLLLTAAVPAGKENIDNGYEVDRIVKCVDWLALMSYDLHGSWENVTGLNSPLYGREGETGLQATLNQDWAVRYWLSKGTPRKLLVLGLAMYGRSFTLHDARNHSIGSPSTSAGQAGQYTGEGGFLSYYEICRGLQTGWTRVWDDQQKAAYAYRGNQWVGYDDVDSVAIKVMYLRKMKLGGAMMWTVALDDFDGQFCGNDTYPLLKTVHGLLTRKMDTDSITSDDETAVKDLDVSNDDETLVKDLNVSDDDETPVKDLHVFDDDETPVKDLHVFDDDETLVKDLHVSDYDETLIKDLNVSDDEETMVKQSAINAEETATKLSVSGPERQKEGVLWSRGVISHPAEDNPAVFKFEQLEIDEFDLDHDHL